MQVREIKDSMGYSLYILQSVSSNKYYVGFSDDPVRRLEFHNSVERGFTARYRPWKIVFSREFSTAKEARDAERTVKSWKSRKMIGRLIAGEIGVIPR